MKTRTKVFTSIIAIMLSVVIAFTAMMFIANTDQTVSASTRTVALEQITYEEQVNYLIDKFDEYSINNNDYVLEFEGILPISLLDVDNASDIQEETNKVVKTNYDLTTNEFFVNVEVYQDNILIESWNEIVTPLYDEEKDEGYIEYKGERYYLSESLTSDVIDDCVVATAAASAGLLAAAALCVTIVLTPPSVHQEIIQSISHVTETIVQAVKSFWSWFTSWITKVFTRTVVTTTVVTTYTPSLTISGKKVETKEVSLTDLKREDRYPKGEYYLCLVSSKKIYISCLPIEDFEAVSILSGGIKVKDENTGEEMLASTYTRFMDDAYRVTVAAGLNPRTPYLKPDYEHGGYHYHSSIEVLVNDNLHSPHSFFVEK